MPIYYSLVSENTEVLCECALASGNFASIARRLIEKIPTVVDTKKSYSHGDQNFHYIVQDGTVYLCMADANVKHRLCFAYLEDVCTRFRGTHGPPPASGERTDVSSFDRILKDRMEFFSYDPEADKISAIQSKISDVKGTMVQNIDKALERGDRIEELVEKTDSLKYGSFVYKRQTTQLSRRMRWRNVRMCVCLLCLLLFLCGGLLFALWYFNLAPGFLPNSPSAPFVAPTPAPHASSGAPPAPLPPPHPPVTVPPATTAAAAPTVAHTTTGTPPTPHPSMDTTVGTPPSSSAVSTTARTTAPASSSSLSPATSAPPDTTGSASATSSTLSTPIATTSAQQSSATTSTTGSTEPSNSTTTI